MKVFGRVVWFGDAEPAAVVIFEETDSGPVSKALNPRYRVVVG